MTGSRSLVLEGAVVSLLLGGGGVALGLAEGPALLWGFGAALLLQVPSALSLAARIQDGFGNRGLERERLMGRTVGVLQRVLALGLLLAAASAWSEAQGLPSRWGQAIAGAGAATFGPLWWLKRSAMGDHPALVQEAARARMPLELSIMLLAGLAAASAHPWVVPVTTLAVALRLFLAGRSLARATTVPAASCGSCGGCSC